MAAIRHYNWENIPKHITVEYEKNVIKNCSSLGQNWSVIYLVRKAAVEIVQAFYEKKGFNLKQIAIQGFVSALVSGRCPLWQKTSHNKSSQAKFVKIVIVWPYPQTCLQIGGRVTQTSVVDVLSNLPIFYPICQSALAIYHKTDNWIPVFMIYHTLQWVVVSP